MDQTQKKKKKKTDEQNRKENNNEERTMRACEVSDRDELLHRN